MYRIRLSKQVGDIPGFFSGLLDKDTAGLIYNTTSRRRLDRTSLQTVSNQHFCDLKLKFDFIFV